MKEAKAKQSNEKKNTAIARMGIRLARRDQDDHFSYRVTCREEGKPQQSQSELVGALKWDHQLPDTPELCIPSQ